MSMRKSKKRNNKGFSLVELIVVIAIMAILAVTLAPRLTHYIEKARKSTDSQVVNTVLSTTQLALADESLQSEFEDVATKVKETNASGAPVSYYLISLEAFYNASTSDQWTKKSSVTNKYYNEVADVLDNFKLKSTSAVGSGTDADATIRNNTDTDIVVLYNVDTKKLSALIDYSGCYASTTTYYKADITTMISGADYVATEE